MLSKQYAIALFELSTKRIDDVKESFDSLIELLKINPDFYKLLTCPTIDKVNKKEIINNTLINFNRNFIDFCYVLVDNSRFDLIYKIYDEFNNIVFDSKGVTVINAITHIPLTDKQIKKLINSLSDKFRGTLKINNIIDSSALGGMRLEHNGVSIDRTLKTQIDDLKALL